MNAAHKLFTWARFADEIRIDGARVRQMAEAGAIVRLQVERSGRLVIFDLKNDVLPMSASQPGVLEAQTVEGQPVRVGLRMSRRMTPDDVPVDADVEL